MSEQATQTPSPLLTPAVIKQHDVEQLEAEISRRLPLGRISHYFINAARSSHAADTEFAYDKTTGKVLYTGKRSDLEGGKKLMFTFGASYGADGHEKNHPLVTTDASLSSVGAHIAPGDNDIVKSVEITTLDTNTTQPLVFGAPNVPAIHGRTTYNGLTHAAAPITRNTKYPLTVVEHQLGTSAVHRLVSAPGVTPSSMHDMADQYGSTAMVIPTAPVAHPVANQILKENDLRRQEGRELLKPPARSQKAAAEAKAAAAAAGRPYTYDFDVDTYNDHKTDDEHIRVRKDHYDEMAERAEKEMRALVPFADVTSSEYGFYIQAANPEEYDERLQETDSKGVLKRDKPLTLEMAVNTRFMKANMAFRPGATMPSPE